jgi:hypothetical protein
MGEINRLKGEVEILTKLLKETREMLNRNVYITDNLRDFIKYNNSTLTDNDINDIACTDNSTGVWRRFKNED